MTRQSVAVDRVILGRNYRRDFEPDALAQLATDIDSNGLLSPPIVREVEDRFELIAGERRFRAMRDVLGWESVEVDVQTFSEERAVLATLGENLSRQDPNPLETAQGFQRALDQLGWTPAELAQSLGLTADLVRRRLSLLSLVDDVAHFVVTGQLPVGRAELMATLDGNRQRLALIAHNGEHLSMPAFRRLTEKLADDQSADGLFSGDDFLQAETYSTELAAVVRGELEAEVPEPVRETPIGLNEIAAALNVKVQTVSVWRTRGKLPEPDLTVSGSPLWWRATVEAWATDTDRPFQLF